jgi:nitrogen regulatory protein P-II 1
VKLIIAIVQSENLEAVEAALSQHGHASLLSISEVLGARRDAAWKEIYRGREVYRRRSWFRLEIAVTDQAVEATLETVVRAGGGSGAIGDCKAFVLELNQYGPLRTGPAEPADTPCR